MVQKRLITKFTTNWYSNGCDQWHEVYKNVRDIIKLTTWELQRYIINHKNHSKRHLIIWWNLPIIFIVISNYKSYVDHHTPSAQWLLHKYKCLWGVEDKGWVQVSRREFHTHIHLDYTRVEFLSYIYIYIKLCSKIYNIFNIFLLKLFVISNTSICKTYLFEFILTLSLALLNSLGLLSSEKKNVN